MHDVALDHAGGNELVTSDQRAEKRARKKKNKTGLQDLPNELLFKIKNLLTELSDHASYRDLCPRTAALYQDLEIRDLCLRANIGRPALWADQSWAVTASKLKNSAI